MLLAMIAIKVEDGWRAPVLYLRRASGATTRPSAS